MSPNNAVEDLEEILEEENFHELDPSLDLTWDNVEDVDGVTYDDAGIVDYD